MNERMNQKLKDKKGFTLVELIVVLVILAILAAVLVPALLGYIDRAKGQQVVVEAKELMTACQAGIAEAYATDKEQFELYCKKTKCTKVTGSYDYVSSHLFASGQGSVESASTPAKDVISKRVLQYVSSKKGAEKKYNFYSPSISGGLDISTIPAGQQAFVIMYNKRGKILYMQYARDGQLVTYNGSTFTVETGGSIVPH